jgi:hypothetical protein
VPYDPIERWEWEGGAISPVAEEAGAAQSGEPQGQPGQEASAPAARSGDGVGGHPAGLYDVVVACVAVSG